MGTKEMLDKMKLKEASLFKINNIKVLDNYLMFYNNDPQITIKFKKKMRNIKLKIILNKPLLKKTNIAIYFSDNKNFNRFDVITWDVKIHDEFERYITFDKEVKYVRIDLSEENIKMYLQSLVIEPSEYIKEDVIIKNIKIENNKLNTLSMVFDESLYKTLNDKSNINCINLIGTGEKGNYYDIIDNNRNKYDYIDLTHKLDDNENFLYIINLFRKNNVNNIVLYGNVSKKMICALKDYGYNIIFVINKMDVTASYLINKIDWIISKHVDDYYLTKNYNTKILITEKTEVPKIIVSCLEEGIQISPSLDLFLWGPLRKTHFLELQGVTQNFKQKRKKLQYAIIKSKLERISINKGTYVLLNTYVGSDNEGDNIIMNYCTDIMHGIRSDIKYINIPTHIYDNNIENIKQYKKILCGTNIIYKNMEENLLWTLPNDISNLKNTILLGVGLQGKDINKQMSLYSKKFFNYILCKDGYHSVRDEHTKQALEKIGISNVLNTGCPTMWNLTKEFCQTIPKTKSESVVTTITDYDKDEKNDLLMLNILKNNYKNVYIWIQGQYDYDYLKTIINLDDFILIPPSLEMLDRILINNDVDYVGTRLHAGIRSLNMKKRSLVISIDNRARDIGEDTNLPILERKKIEYDLENWINSEYITQINIPEKNIELWKKQFKKQ